MLFRKPCGSSTILTLLTFVLVCIIGVPESTSIAIAPSTFGTAIARAGKLSNSLKVSTIVLIINKQTKKTQYKYY